MGGTTSREGQTFVGESLLVRYVNFVKLPHTVFALPFALLGLVVASRETALTWRTLGLVVLAFTCARFVALGFNRIADRELDARNPRTRARELPSGRLTLRQAWVAVVVAAVVFLATAWALNPLCFALAPLALVFISAYSYAKRFTHWSHLWLGLADGIATPAGYLAVTGRWSEPWWLLPVGALAVTFWVGGFDVFYALQDEAFDRAERLESAVVPLGARPAILAAKTLHGLTPSALVAVGSEAGLGVAASAGPATRHAPVALSCGGAFAAGGGGGIGARGKRVPARRWFSDAKFGLFIHWGVYSQLGAGEWVMQNRKIAVADYEWLATTFNPMKFDAVAWVALAKRAGVRYITITSRHHDGFAMFQTAQTPYNIVDGTPFRRDPLKELADACHTAGINLFFYDSQPVWHHPDYLPPGRTAWDNGRPDHGDWSRYLAFMNAQLTELLTRYGEVGGIWFDGMWDKPDAPWQLDSTYGLIHRLQPAALVVPNHHQHPRSGEDRQTFEQG